MMQEEVKEHLKKMKRSESKTSDTGSKISDASGKDSYQGDPDNQSTQAEWTQLYLTCLLPELSVTIPSPLLWLTVDNLW